MNPPILDETTQKNVSAWLEGDYDPETKAEIQRMLTENPQEIVEAFYTKMAFGTAGMRGLMGIGSNRMNLYTVRAATQGLANTLLKQPVPPHGHSVFIGYDSRHHSQEFAQESAKVLAGNGIIVYLCKEIRPTPYVSFSCRYKHCSAAIMVTASHNPAQYNGYKVYWSDGGQVTPPHDKNIIAEFDAITDLRMIKHVDTLQHPLIKMVGPEEDVAYIQALSLLQLYPKENLEYGKSLGIVYTSLHGTGITLMPQAAAAWGFKQLIFVKDQIIPDGNFPTVAVPNPEEPEALTLGIQTLKETASDVLIANDPDADRVAIVVKHRGKFEVLNGNQIACICLEHICHALTERSAMPARAAFIKSIVTTEMFRAIAKRYDCSCFDVLPGFKYIAEKIRTWEQDPQGYQYIFGGEESYGYLLGTQERDKDAILSGVLLCEAALHAKRQGKTLIDRLHELYRKYGMYVEELLSVNFEETKTGKERIKTAIERLRATPPQTIGGVDVEFLEDYSQGKKIKVRTGKVEDVALPLSNVLLFWLSDETKLIVRPSGTEPKIKLYCGVIQKQFSSIDEAQGNCQARAHQLLKEVQHLLMYSRLNLE